MTKAVGLAVLMLLGVGIDAALACSVPFIRTFDNQTVSGTMTLKAGKRCSIRLTRSPGPIHSAEIVQRPTNGRVSIEAGNRVVYVPRAGFTGRDSFTYARRGFDTGNRPIVRTVQIAVTVLP
jgi:Bacterial Ig domain